MSLRVVQQDSERKITGFVKWMSLPTTVVERSGTKPQVVEERLEDGVTDNKETGE